MIGINKVLGIVISAAAITSTAGYSQGWRMKPKKYAASKTLGDSYFQNLNGAAPAAPAASAPAYSAAPAGPAANNFVADGSGWRMKPKKYAASKTLGDTYFQNLNGAAPTAYVAAAPAGVAPQPAAAATPAAPAFKADGSGWRMKPKKYAASKTLGDGYFQNLNGAAPAGGGAAAASSGSNVISNGSGWRMKPKKYAASKTLGDSYFQNL